MESRCQCRAYETLRTQPGDHNEAYAAAFAEGRTGFPMVDACMRCLLQTGWVFPRLDLNLFACSAADVTWS